MGDFNSVMDEVMDKSVKITTCSAMPVVLKKVVKGMRASGYLERSE